MEKSKYQEGDTVTAKDAPDVKLVIRRYIHDIYYCRIKDHPELKELRELNGSE